MMQQLSCAWVILLICYVVVCAESEELVSWESIYRPADCSVTAKTMDILAVHYTGYIAPGSTSGTEGSIFDTSRKRGREAIRFKLGAGEVVKGWDIGLDGICAGEKRTLLIPPSFGYGERGAGSVVPPHATLRFEVECMSINEVKRKENNFVKIDEDNDGAITYEEMLQWYAEKLPENQKPVYSLPPLMFEKQDKNQDGKIQWEEFDGPKGYAPPTPRPTTKEDL